MRSLVLVTLAACGRFGFGDATRIDGGDDEPPDVLGLSLDATIVADGVAAAACGSTVLVSDGFDASGPAPTFTAYTDSGLTLQETNSELRVVFGSSVPDGRYSGYKSTSRPVEGLCGSVHVLGTASSNGFSYMKLWSNAEQVELAVYKGNLSARTHLDKQVALLLQIPFDPVAHAWWRLRQQAGVTYWDVSPDGVTYTLLASTTFVTVPTLAFELGAGAFGTAQNAGVTAFDDALLTAP